MTHLQAATRLGWQTRGDQNECPPEPTDRPAAINRHLTDDERDLLAQLTVWTIAEQTGVSDEEAARALDELNEKSGLYMEGDAIDAYVKTTEHNHVIVHVTREWLAHFTTCHPRGTRRRQEVRPLVQAPHRRGHQRMTTYEDVPLLAVYYSDIGIVLRTRGGAEVTIPPNDALDLAAALAQAVQDLEAHQQLIGAVEGSFTDQEDTE